jgi:hypothetical protein
MEDQNIILERLTRLTRLLEDSLIVSAIQSGANRKALARFLGLQDTRISSVAKVFSGRNTGEGRRVG